VKEEKINLIFQIVFKLKFIIFRYASYMSIVVTHCKVILMVCGIHAVEVDTLEDVSNFLLQKAELIFWGLLCYLEI
jgi:hypothetical protein